MLTIRLIPYPFKPLHQPLFLVSSSGRYQLRYRFSSAITTALCAVLLWLLPLTMGNAAAMSPQATPQIDQLIIKYRAESLARLDQLTFRTMAARAAAESTGMQVAYKRAMANITGAHVLKLPHPISAEQAQAYAQKIMQQHAGIDYVEPDYRRYVQRTIPNDTEFNQQWHLLAPEDFPGAANVVNAWDISQGKPEIVVAVLDEGMTDHADLRPAFVGGSLLASGYDMITQAAEAGDGDGRDSNPTNPGVAADSHHNSRWHGTHVGGIISARPDNGQFTAGVGWHTRLLAVRILSERGGYLSDQVDGMLWAAGEQVPGVPDNPHPAHVLNMSVGSSVAFDCARTEQAAIDRIRARGVSIVVAAGNLNKNISAYAPGNCQGVIAVGGVMPDGARAPYSNYGALVDIAAPAEKIYSSANTGTHVPLADSSRFESGTSQATPQVAGVLALMLAANEHLLDAAVVQPADLPGLLEAKLKQAARAFPTQIAGAATALGCNEHQQTPCVCTTATCGAGLLDAHAALQAVTIRPKVDAGSDRQIRAAATVHLEGSASTDERFGGKIIRFKWEQLQGPAVLLHNSALNSARFVAPTALSADQVLRFQLTATDDVGLSNRAEVQLTVPGTANPDGSVANNAGANSSAANTNSAAAHSSGSGGGGSLLLAEYEWLALLLILLVRVRRYVTRG